MNTSKLRTLARAAYDKSDYLIAATLCQMAADHYPINELSELSRKDRAGLQLLAAQIRRDYLSQESANI